MSVIHDGERGTRVVFFLSPALINWMLSVSQFIKGHEEGSRVAFEHIPRVKGIRRAQGPKVDNQLH